MCILNTYLILISNLIIMEIKIKHEGVAMCAGIDFEDMNTLSYSIMSAAAPLKLEQLSQLFIHSTNKKKKKNRSW